MTLCLPPVKPRPEPTAIWKSPCKFCPSAYGSSDPEAQDMERWFKDGSITWRDAIFPCAWRPTKFCKGVCDRMGIAMVEEP